MSRHNSVVLDCVVLCCVAEVRIGRIQIRETVAAVCEFLWKLQSHTNYLNYNGPGVRFGRERQKIWRRLTEGIRGSLKITLRQLNY